MKNRYSLACFLLAVSLSISAAAFAFQQSTASVAGAAVNQILGDFKLPDAASSTERSLRSLKGANGTVLIFISTQCPVSNAYNERMEKLATDYKARGINIVGINSNKAETPDDIKRHAAEKNLTFPILKDAGNKVADMLGANVTPETFFLDASNKLVYHGRIDNSRNAASITANDLREALDAHLAGKAVAKTEAKAFGCSIKRAS